MNEEVNKILKRYVISAEPNKANADYINQLTERLGAENVIPLSDLITNPRELLTNLLTEHPSSSVHLRLITPRLTPGERELFFANLDRLLDEEGLRQRLKTQISYVPPKWSNLSGLVNLTYDPSSSAYILQDQAKSRVLNWIQEQKGFANLIIGGNNPTTTRILSRLEAENIRYALPISEKGVFGPTILIGATAQDLLDRAFKLNEKRREVFTKGPKILRFSMDIPITQIPSPGPPGSLPMQRGFQYEAYQAATAFLQENFKTINSITAILDNPEIKLYAARLAARKIVDPANPPLLRIVAPGHDYISTTVVKPPPPQNPLHIQRAYPHFGANIPIQSIPELGTIAIDPEKVRLATDIVPIPDEYRELISDPIMRTGLYLDDPETLEKLRSLYTAYPNDPHLTAQGIGFLTNDPAKLPKATKIRLIDTEDMSVLVKTDKLTRFFESTLPPRRRATIPMEYEIHPYVEVINNRKVLRGELRPTQLSRLVYEFPFIAEVVATRKKATHLLHSMKYFHEGVPTPIDRINKSIDNLVKSFGTLLGTSSQPGLLNRAFQLGSARVASILEKAGSYHQWGMTAPIAIGFYPLHSAEVEAIDLFKHGVESLSKENIGSIGTTIPKYTFPTLLLKYGDPEHPITRIVVPADLTRRAAIDADLDVAYLMAMKRGRKGKWTPMSVEEAMERGRFHAYFVKNPGTQLFDLTEVHVVDLTDPSKASETMARRIRIGPQSYTIGELLGIQALDFDVATQMTEDVFNKVSFIYKPTERWVAQKGLIKSISKRTVEPAIGLIDFSIKTNMLAMLSALYRINPNAKELTKALVSSRGPVAYTKEVGIEGLSAGLTAKSMAGTQSPEVNNFIRAIFERGPFAELDPMSMITLIQSNQATNPTSRLSMRYGYALLGEALIEHTIRPYDISYYEDPEQIATLAQKVLARAKERANQLRHKPWEAIPHPSPTHLSRSVVLPHGLQIYKMDPGRVTSEEEAIVRTITEAAIIEQKNLYVYDKGWHKFDHRTQQWVKLAKRPKLKEFLLYTGSEERFVTSEFEADQNRWLLYKELEEHYTDKVETMMIFKDLPDEYPITKGIAKRYIVAPEIGSMFYYKSPEIRQVLSEMIYGGSKKHHVFLAAGGFEFWETIANTMATLSKVFQHTKNIVVAGSLSIVPKGPTQYLDWQAQEAALDIDRYLGLFRAMAHQTQKGLPEESIVEAMRELGILRIESLEKLAQRHMPDYIRKDAPYPEGVRLLREGKPAPVMISLHPITGEGRQNRYFPMGSFPRMKGDPPISMAVIHPAYSPYTAQWYTPIQVLEASMRQQGYHISKEFATSYIQTAKKVVEETIKNNTAAAIKQLKTTLLSEESSPAQQIIQAARILRQHQVAPETVLERLLSESQPDFTRSALKYIRQTKKLIKRFRKLERAADNADKGIWKTAEYRKIIQDLTNAIDPQDIADDPLAIRTLKGNATATVNKLFAAVQESASTFGTPLPGHVIEDLLAYAKAAPQTNTIIRRSMDLIETQAGRGLLRFSALNLLFTVSAGELTQNPEAITTLLAAISTQLGGITPYVQKSGPKEFGTLSLFLSRPNQGLLPQAVLHFLSPSVQRVQELFPGHRVDTKLVTQLAHNQGIRHALDPRRTVENLMHLVLARDLKVVNVLHLDIAGTAQLGEDLLRQQASNIAEVEGKKFIRPTGDEAQYFITPEGMRELATERQVLGSATAKEAQFLSVNPATGQYRPLQMTRLSSLQKIRTPFSKPAGIIPIEATGLPSDFQIFFGGERANVPIHLITSTQEAYDRAYLELLHKVAAPVEVSFGPGRAPVRGFVLPTVVGIAPDEAIYDKFKHEISLRGIADTGPFMAMTGWSPRETLMGVSRSMEKHLQNVFRVMIGLVHNIGKRGVPI